MEKKQERNKLFKKCIEDLDKLQIKSQDLYKKPQTTTLENQLTFTECDNSSPVPYNKNKKLQNLTSETIDVSEYSDEGVKVMNKTNGQDTFTPPKLIRSNSYTLESPSPILLAHLEKEARKCVEIEDSSESPVTVIDSEPPIQVTDISVERIAVSTPKSVEPQLLEILDKLPQDHAKNILKILEERDDRSMNLSISSQSLYYSVLSPDTTHESPNSLNLINLRNSRNTMDKNKAASIIGAAVRGYLVRRLIRTEKVQSLIETIKDALLCALQLHHTEVIEPADVELHRRLIQQVSAACYAFHDIFFSLSIKEKMGIITVDRQRRIEKANRPLSATSSNLSLSRRQSARIVR